MNLKQLHYFYTAAKYHSINKAAKELFLTAPALSHSISALENELGYSLFYRDNTGIFLTSAGEAFLDDVKKILDMEEGWKQIAKKTAEMPSQINVSLAAIPIIYHSVVGDMVLDIMAQALNVNLIVKECTVQEIDDAMFAHQLSFAIQGYDPENIALEIAAQNLGMEMTPLYLDRYVAFVSANNPLFMKGCCTVEELRAFTGLSLNYPSVSRLAYQKIFEPSHTLYFYNYSALLKYLTESDCFTVLPNILTHNIYCEQGLLRPVEIAGDIFPHAYALITKPEKVMNHPEKMVASAIRKYFQALFS